MNSLRLIALAITLWSNFSGYAQRTISEGTILYDISIISKSKGASASPGLNGAKSIVYLKGGLSRTDMTSALGTETTIYNSKIGNAVILKEYSGQKLMITMTRQNWESSNNKFDGINFETSSETKVIDGYNCKKAFAKLKDGSTITVYFTPELIAINKEYNRAFSTLAGFPIEYEFETEKLTIRYQLSKIDYTPLMSAKFDFPKTGYRVMTFDENKSGKGPDF